MRNHIYQIAYECQQYANNNINIQRNKIQQSNNRVQLTFTDYDVLGDIKQYEILLLKLCNSIEGKYPSIWQILKTHIDKYDTDRIIHFSAIRAIVDCIVSLEERVIESKKLFISHSSKDEKVVKEFIEKILMLGCGFKRADIFCTLDHTTIRTGDDFRNEIIENMKSCDYILCFISNNYRNSEICQNEMGAAWTFNDKRVLPFKFPSLQFSEIGFLNVVKQGADIMDRSKLDELYEELCEFYGIQTDWKNFNDQKENFINFVNKNLNNDRLSDNI